MVQDKNSIKKKGQNNDIVVPNVIPSNDNTAKSITKDIPENSDQGTQDEKEQHQEQKQILNIAEICDNLKRAFKEEGTDDPISLITIIDIYTQQLLKTSNETLILQFLDVLQDELIKADDRLLKEIGWDLPKILLQFIRFDYLNVNIQLKFNKPLRIVMRCFNELVLRGNPKELFLTGCELLNNLNFDDEKAEEKKVCMNLDFSKINQVLTRDPAEFTLELKFHILEELVSSTMRKIDNNPFPSKFLAMSTDSLLRFIRNNNSKIQDSFFILRRIYTFIRGYEPPQYHSTTHTAPITDYDEEGENLLQRKLLVNFTTTVFPILFNTHTGQLAWIYYSENISCNQEDIRKARDLEKNPAYHEFITLYERFYQLCNSFDVDIEKEFVNLCCEESKSIYNAIPQTTSSDAISQVIFQLPVAYEFSKLKNERKIPINFDGILLLACYHYHKNDVTSAPPQLNLTNMIYLFLRVTSPGTISPALKNDIVKECVYFFIWYCFKHAASCESLMEELSKISSFILITFFQLLLLDNITPNYTGLLPNAASRMCSLTLLTRFLCLSPNKVSFEFIKDTLLSCPYPEGKVFIISIMKDLMTRKCNVSAVNTTLNIELSNLHLTAANSSAENSDINVDKGISPTLSEKGSACCYIEINDDIMATIHSLTMLCIDTIRKSALTIFDVGTSIGDSNGSDSFKVNLQILLSYLNFYCSVYQKWNSNLLEIVNSEISTFLKTHKKNDDSQYEKYPEIQFIDMANKTLYSFIKIKDKENGK
ncbi:uncharacterized protein SCODWIG_01291 [Saccharomycodes ludwigii]|uniref:YAP1-binding protein 1 n=1 Tax=Saccharomycodes ludwigii TaxID=36035 RepID=A0A376B5Y5_9ASCO|nr:uncharacterized protein SCODWIG_01291 [Saccharomycodes ludwigii]